MTMPLVSSAGAVGSDFSHPANSVNPARTNAWRCLRMSMASVLLAEYTRLQRGQGGLRAAGRGAPATSLQPARPASRPEGPEIDRGRTHPAPAGHHQRDPRLAGSLSRSRHACVTRVALTRASPASTPATAAAVARGCRNALV